jgi:hypothetical protein
MLFCNDTDLLYWEPEVLREATFVSQTLDAGTGDLSGTQFTLVSGAAFTSRGVEPGQVIVLSGAVAGCFPIVEVTGASLLQLGVLNDEFFPDPPATPPAPVSPGAATALDFVIRTFWAQRRIVSDLIAQSIGIVPTTDGDDDAAPQVLNPQSLRRAATLGTLQMIYNAMAAAATEPARFTVRADLYERLYRRALRQAQVDIDLDGDGRADTRRSPGLLRMVRV